MRCKNLCHIILLKSINALFSLYLHVYKEPTKINLSIKLFPQCNQAYTAFRFKCTLNHLHFHFPLTRKLFLILKSIYNGV